MCCIYILHESLLFCNSHAVAFGLLELLVIAESFFEIALDEVFEAGDCDDVEFAAWVEAGFCVCDYGLKEFFADFCGDV